MKKIVIVGICMLIVVGAVATWYVKENYCEEKEEKVLELQLEISLSKTEFLVGEPINLTVMLKNVGNESVNVSEYGVPLQALRIKLTTSDGGDVLYCLGLSLNVTVRPPFGTTLEPNEIMEWKADIVACWWWNVSGGQGKYLSNKTGEFSIQSIYTSSTWDIPVWEGTLTSNSVAFTITSG